MPFRTSFTTAVTAFALTVPIISGCGGGTVTTSPTAGASTATTPTHVASSAASTVTATAPTGTPTGDPPSSCRPGNNSGVVTLGDASAGHRHYRVTLTAAPGYGPCALKGAPAQVRFLSPAGSMLDVPVSASTDPGTSLTFEPGRPVHFDVEVPNGPVGLRASTITFVLQTGDGDIPGQQAATGDMEVVAGARVGPVQTG